MGAHPNVPAARAFDSNPQEMIMRKEVRGRLDDADKR